MSNRERIVWRIFRSKMHIALLTVFLAAFWQIYFRFPLPPSYYLMIALHTVGTSLVNALTDGREDALNAPDRERSVRPLTPIARALSLICFLVSFGIAVSAGWKVVLFGTLLNALAALYGYAIPIRTRHGTGELRFKSLLIVKNIYASFHWSVALILGMYIFADQPFDGRALIPMVILFLIAFFVELMWDIRDMPGDRLAGVNTIPVRFGEPVARVTLHLLNLATAVVGTVALLSDALPPFYWIFAANTALSAWFIEQYMASKNRPLASHFYVIYATLFLAAAVAGDLYLRSRAAY
ncbi:MAG: UbiA family prenyltransferase [Akkermansiaceae bacterium]|nr:UbiA family prenyltransferase [Armatimonadota bacterium]